MDVTNNTLMWLVVVAIGVSVIGTFFSMNTLNNDFTGLTIGDTSNATGNITISLSTQTTLRYYTSTLDFGSGAVDTNVGYCNLTLNGTGNQTINKSGCQAGTFSNSAYALSLENAGSTHMNVTLNFSSNASTLIGGGQPSYTDPLFQYTVSENETGSCISGLTPGVWTNVSANTVTLICGNLSYSDGTDSLIIGIKLGIPLNAVSGPKTVNIIAQGTSLE